MFCSTIIPTIGRPSLARAVNSVLEQEFTADEFEVIVVNDSGRPLPGADWQQSERVQIIHTNRRERSVARNTGAALARGHYLHFLDDDDWLLPDAFSALWELAQKAPEASWLYGDSQLVDRQGCPLIELQHGIEGNCFIQAMAGEWIPLQSSFIKAEFFFSARGFHPLITSSEDVDLLRRITLTGNIADTKMIIAYIEMGSQGSTTDHTKNDLYSRCAREDILNSAKVFTRMRTSSGESYWHGRMTRIYFTSVIWNLQHKRLFTAVSRTAFGLVSLLFAGYHLLSPEFWQAVLYKYTSFTFLRGLHAKGEDHHPENRTLL